jgi:hypothetical protein
MKSMGLLFNSCAVISCADPQNSKILVLKPSTISFMSYIARQAVKVPITCVRVSQRVMPHIFFSWPVTKLGM